MTARGLHVQTVEETALDWEDYRSLRRLALGSTDFQLHVQADFDREGWLSRRRRRDLQTGDRLFDDAVQVHGEGDALARLLDNEPVRLAVMDLVSRGALCIANGTVRAVARQCSLDEARLAVTVITRALDLLGRATAAPRIAGGAGMPWLEVLSPRQHSLTIVGDRVDPQHVAGVPELESLTLSDLELTSSDLTPFTALSRLKTLRLVCIDGVCDLAPLADMPWLQELAVTGCPVDDVEPLRHLTGLERLDLSQSRICDLSPLSALASLKNLVLVETPVEEMQLTRLREHLPSLEIVRE